MDLVKALMAWGKHKYSPLPEQTPESESGRRQQSWSDAQRSALKFTMTAISLLVVLYLAIARVVRASPTCIPRVCDTPEQGFQCSPAISHYWGQYSPFFSVPSEIDNSIPSECKVTFVQTLSRHGARDPTASKTKTYSNLVNRIHSQATSYGSGFEFIKNYSYTLGADQLTVFGQQQMINSGIKFYTRYEELTKTESPFVRSSGQDRVVESAQNWTQGFHQARLADKASTTPDAYPYDIVAISEDAGVNNTLSHGLCNDFEDGPLSEVGDDAQAKWLKVFAPAITARLNSNLPGANITDKETVYMMDLCPFNTVANTNGTLSPFCKIFTQDEWKSYDYFQSLGKWYGYGPGNPLGPTNGVGFTNELIARLTNQPVNDHTSTNTTLDTDPEDFPLGRKLYADFSHDNDMTTIYAALGLYNATAPLSNTTRESTSDTKGYSASWTVTFAGRVYVEKMTCGAGSNEELVRILVNDRVVPLQNCGADALGRCALSKFVDSLSFARSGGDWAQCFI